MNEEEKDLSQVENETVEETTVEETQETNEENQDNKVENEVIEDKKEDTVDVKPEERPIWTMPVAKAQKEKERAVEKALTAKEEEFNAKFESIRKEYEDKLSSGQSTTDLDGKLANISEKYGLDIQAAKELLNVFKESIDIPDLSKYDQIFEDKKIDEAKMKVSQEFDNEVSSQILKDFPTATTEDISKIKKEISELAFTARYNTYALSDIYTVNKSKWEIKNNYTGEDPGGRTSDIGDIGSLSEEEALKLSPSQYVIWQDIQAGKGSQYVDL